MKTLRIFLTLLLLALTAPLARATVTNSVSSTTIAGTGSLTLFTFNFIGVTANDITVIYTDAAGNETVVPQGQYTLQLNSALPGNIWGIGGSVTYPLVGSPIANGTTLTISRTVPNTQTVSSNQGQAFPTAVEGGLDLLAMQIQQLTATGHLLQASPADTCATLGFLPQAVQRANQVIGFDGTGCNPVAVSTLPSATVSSAMQPVISAASLGAGRTAFGLGTMATENFGAALQDDGAGNARVNFATASDATNQTVTSAFHLTQRFATAGITYTLPLSSTVWNGFGFWVTALSGQVTLSPNASDNFSGMGSGVALIILPGQNVFLATNATGTWWAQNVQLVGSTTPLNMQISATAASNQLTIAVKNLNGNDPSATSPVLVGFRSETLTSGNTIIGTITAPLSFTLNTTSSMGCTTAVACRLWGEMICQTESSGACTSVLVGVSSQSTATACYPLSEYDLQTTGSGTGGGTTINTIQTSVSALSSKAIRIAFYVEDTWTSSVGWGTPSVVQVFGAGVPKPCQVVQTISSAPIASTTNIQTTQTQTAITAAITPTSALNLIEAHCTCAVATGAASSGILQMSRGTTPKLFGSVGFIGQAGSGTTAWMMPLTGFDKPASTSAQSYYVFGECSGNNDCVTNDPSGGFQPSSQLILQEIMGALEPDNDNGLIRKAA
jgi:hypothetical protein